MTDVANKTEGGRHYNERALIMLECECLDGDCCKIKRKPTSSVTLKHFSYIQCFLTKITNFNISEAECNL